RYVRAAGNSASHFELLLAQPKRLEILLGIFAASQFLADALIHDPEFLNWVTASEVINGARPRSVIESDLIAFTEGLNHTEWLNAVRRFRCREILRIGTRDICLHAPIVEITADLSALADAMVRAALEHYWRETGRDMQSATASGPGSRPAGFCILAFGKLGGRELNYSSDIDLLGVYDADQASAGKDHESVDSNLFYRAIGQVGNYLSAHTAEGHAYRVDFRLRPYGQAGQLAYSLPALADYYRAKAALWEIQALLKARPIAGSEKLGRSFLDLVTAIIQKRKGAREIIASIEATRDANIIARPVDDEVVADIKNGSGGIRDIEFLVQGLQLIHSPSIPELINGNTTEALTLLGAHDLMPRETAEQLKRDYEFLRRVEHCLQIFEDQQVHVLPDQDEERDALAKRVFGFKATADELLKEIKLCQARVQDCFRLYLTHR
ncbi:MAG: hypothetical protein Q7J98_12055, partial [Kiritimatiellia bacterium]|nr:hypothetical protein [Kiritimatiellia bacterium]